MEQRSLADLLMDQDESLRLAVVAELLVQVESYYRTLGCMLRGMAAREVRDLQDVEAKRDILAALRVSEECSSWIAGHVCALTLPEQTPSVPIPKAEADEAGTATVH